MNDPRDALLATFGRAGILFRLLTTPLVAVFMFTGGEHLHPLIPLALGVVIVENLVLLLWPAGARAVWRSWWVFAFDACLIAGISLSTATLADPGAINDLNTHADLFSIYVLPTTALWVILRAERAALICVAGAAGMSAEMVVLNGAIADADWQLYAFRLSWVFLIALVALMMRRLSMGGAQAAVDSARLSAKASERTWILHDLLRSSIDEITGAVNRAIEGGSGIDEVSGVARSQASRIRGVLRQHDEGRGKLFAAITHAALGAADPSGAAATVVPLGPLPDATPDLRHAAAKVTRDTIALLARADHPIELNLLVTAEGDVLRLVFDARGSGIERHPGLAGVRDDLEVRRQADRITVVARLQLREEETSLSETPLPSGITLSIDAAVTRLAGAAFALRALVLPFQLIMLPRGDGPRGPIIPLSVLIVAVAAANAVFAARVSGDTEGKVLRARGVLLADAAVVVALNLGVSAWFPDGTLDVLGRDPFYVHIFTGIAVWTAVRGWKLGITLAVGASLLQVLNFVANDALSVIPVDRLVTNVLLTFLWVGVAHVTLTYVRRGTRAAAAKAAFAAAEEERAMLLRSIHDTVLQTLESIALAPARAGRPDRRRLDEISLALAEEARRLTAPPSGPDLQLSDVVVEACDSFAYRTGLIIEIRGAEEALPLDGLHQAALSGAFQEILRNVERHASASAVVVEIEGDHAVVRLSVQDDGIGFTPDALPEGRFGIANSIRRRVEDVGGSSTVVSTPGGGTRWTIGVPALPRDRVPVGVPA